MISFAIFTLDLTETAISVGVDGVTRISVTDCSFSSGEVGWYDRGWGEGVTVFTP